MEEHFVREQTGDEIPISGGAVLHSPVKLTNQPWLVTCVPCGDKKLHTKLTCPKELGGCGQTYLTDSLRHPHMVPLPWHIAFTNMQRPLNVSGMFLWDSGRPSAEARQRMTLEAMRLGAAFILYNDDDTLAPPMGLYTAMNFLGRTPEAGAVMGVYATRENPSEILVYKEHGKGTYWNLEIGPNAQPEVVFGGGAGFILARVEAIKAAMNMIGEGVPVWADELLKKSEVNSVNFGHDMRFCYLLNKAGWPVYADGRIVCRHYDTESGVYYDVPEDYPGRKRYEERMKRDAENKVEATSEIPTIEGQSADTGTEEQTQS